MPPTDTNKQNKPQFQEIVDRLSEANNVLITVSNNPSVDQLAACIGLTIALNKKDKHATAVFSGAVPSTIDFLEPEKTLEKNTDSLRDFIIALDKAKADKLRYKVEDEVVKIFITPYKTSISEADLEFSQGDFNVDAIVAIGVRDRNELDAAIVAHGRILHDATIISIIIGAQSELGAINWQDDSASSLSEMVSDLVQSMDDQVLDSQIATAFLTGIVAETDRFRNEKSSPHTMSVAGILMSAGASTQLVSSKLEQPEEPKEEEKPVQQDHNDPTPPQENEEPPKQDDGTIQIDHSEIHIDESGNLAKVSDILKDIDEEAQKEKAEDAGVSDEGASLPEPTEPQAPLSGPSMIYEPPTFGGQLTANTDKVDQQYTSAPDPLTVPPAPQGPTLSHSQSSAPPLDTPADQSSQTLSDLERSLNSPHVTQYEETPVPPLPSMTPSPDVPPAQPDQARDAVERAMQGSTDYRPEPIQALGANPVNLDITHNEQPQPPAADPNIPPAPPVPPPLPPVG